VTIQTARSAHEQRRSRGSANAGSRSEHAPTPAWWSPKYLLLGLGLVALLALLSYPLFPSPVGLGALAALAVTRTLLLAFTTFDSRTFLSLPAWFVDATGSVMNLAPGQTKSATLLAIGPPPPYDRVSFAVDALLE
jgi:hypothetical protein